jgi:hypothetical protein
MLTNLDPGFPSKPVRLLRAKVITEGFSVSSHQSSPSPTHTLAVFFESLGESAYCDVTLSTPNRCPSRNVDDTSGARPAVVRSDTGMLSEFVVIMKR